MCLMHVRGCKCVLRMRGGENKSCEWEGVGRRVPSVRVG